MTSADKRQWKLPSHYSCEAQGRTTREIKSFILNNVEGLRNPKLKNPTDISKAQWYLHQELREKSGESSNRWSEGRWRELIPLYGEEVAAAYREGALHSGNLAKASRGSVAGKIHRA